MLRTINRKFYVFAGVLVGLFCLAYVQVVHFIGRQSRIAARGEAIIDLERDVRNLQGLFFRLRFWERAVFSQEFPDAERNFGHLLAQMKTQLPDLKGRAPGTFIDRELDQVLQRLAVYEQYFNRLIQLNTDQRLQRTRLDSSYQSLASAILDTGEVSLLKPLVIVTHFQMGYARDHQPTGYQALQLVIDSLKRKFAQADLLDERLESYMDGYRRVLEEDFGLDQQFKVVAKQFYETSATLADLLNAMSREMEIRLAEEFSNAETIRNQSKYAFLMSSGLGVATLLLILLIGARKIVRPIRSVAQVIVDIQAGNTGSRFNFAGSRKDDIVRLGYAFNDMLDTLAEKNRQLILYQTELEMKVQELALRQQERETLIEELETNNAELERFTYTVSHDLKSPLVTIRGFLGFLVEDMAAGDAQRVGADVARIAEATDKMQALLDDLLELSRIGRIIHPPEVIDFEQIVTEAVEMVSGRLRARKVRIRIDTGAGTLYGDRQRLREVFENLLDNAVKYLGDQPAPEIRVGTRPGDQGTVYFVQDNGIGVAPPYREKIFGLFEKLDPQVEGTGVGLSIVKRIIEVHGGRIWVESEGLGQGSAFCFTLPDQPQTREHRSL